MWYLEKSSHTNKQNKTEVENCSTDIIRQFSSRNKNPLQEPVIVLTKFHITDMTNQRPILAEGDFIIGSQNANQPNL